MQNFYDRLTTLSGKFKNISELERTERKFIAVSLHNIYFESMNHWEIIKYLYNSESSPKLLASNEEGSKYCIFQIEAGVTLNYTAMKESLSNYSKCKHTFFW